VQNTHQVIVSTEVAWADDDRRLGPLPAALAWNRAKRCRVRSKTVRCSAKKGTLVFSVKTKERR
jgi:hypothetical protein